MERIIIHWTAGTNNVSWLDRKHYHYIIGGDGKSESGDHAPEANLNVSDGRYAAHTRALNTGSVGVAVAGMAGARERPFSAGSYPMNEGQITALAALVADLCDTYGIAVTRRTVLTHAEVQPTLGVWQRGKWDITWLPGMSSAGDPIEVGDRLRQMVKDAQNPQPEQPDDTAELERLRRFFHDIKGRVAEFEKG